MNDDENSILLQIAINRLMQGNESIIAPNCAAEANALGLTNCTSPIR